MKKTKLTLTILLSFTLILGQSESIKQWSELLGKMQHTIREDMSEQTDFDIDVKAIEVQINHLEKQIGNNNDAYKKAELQAEAYSLTAEVYIGKIIRLERKLQLADLITGMLKDLTHILLNKNGGSKLQKKFHQLVQRQANIKSELIKTNQIYANLISYFPLSSDGAKYINKYREMSQRKMSKQKNYKKQTVRFYERQFEQLERMELQIIENYSPLDVELDILSMEMELETLMLDAALHSIEISGEFINEMLNHGTSNINWR